MEAKMQEARYVIVEWSPTAKLWVATSNDVSGLLAAAETYELLLSKLRVEIPELLKANGHLTDEQIFNSPIHLIAHREDIISFRDPDNIAALLEHAIASSRKPSTPPLN
jgi:hypothetical protein